METRKTKAADHFFNINMSYDPSTDPSRARGAIPSTRLDRRGRGGRAPEPPCAEAESLVRALLTTDSAARLGAPGAGGAAAVRAHAWFVKRFGRVDDAAAGAEEEGGWADLLAKASTRCGRFTMMLVSVSQKVSGSLPNNDE